MKTIIYTATIIALLFTNCLCAQQNIVSANDIDTAFQEGVKIFAAGNANTQSLSQVAAGGKIAFSIIPYAKEIPDWNHRSIIASSYLTFNANANNKDTLLAGNVLFPDLGSASFNGTLETGVLTNKIHSTTRYYYGLFGEFSYKKISSARKDTSNYFNALNYSGGIKGVYYYQPGDDKPLFSFTGLLYYNFTHIPDKDTGDYRYLLGTKNLANSINSIGFKITMGVNYMQFFADFRHAFYSSTQTINRDIFSFTSNIGVILPVEIKSYN